MPDLSTMQIVEVIVVNGLGLVICVTVFFMAGTLGKRQENKQDDRDKDGTPQRHYR